MSSSHNKPADNQRRLEFFRQLQSRKPATNQRPQFAAPRFITTPRRPGMRGK